MITKMANVSEALRKSGIKVVIGMRGPQSTLNQLAYENKIIQRPSDEKMVTVVMVEFGIDLKSFE